VHEQGGMKVPAGQPEALAQALVCLLHNPEKRMEMGRYNRQLIETQMSWDCVAQQLEAIYENVLAQRASADPGGVVPLAFGLKAGSAAQNQVTEL
jgi:glycosyltransferase involved in cell wall biosynthesis